MSNIEGIRPYFEFSHEAKQHGGVEGFLNDYAEVNQRIGIEQERSTETWKGAILLFCGIVAWEGVKAGFYWIKERYQRKKVERLVALERQSEMARKAIIDNNNSDSTRGTPPEEDNRA